MTGDTYKIYVKRGVVRIRSSKGEIPVHGGIDAIVIATSRISITGKAVRLLALMGVDLVFLAPNGEPIARVYPPIINKTVALRRAQYEAYMTDKRIEIARVIVKSKIFNQANLLRYMAKSRREDWLRDEAIRLDEIALSADKARGPDELIQVEAHAARLYWQTVAQLLPKEYGFTGRKQEGVDPFNLMLNYGYGILKYFVEKRLLIYGFDPYAGFLHSDKSGKPSLTLDVMEPFRPIVDKALIIECPRANVVGGYLDYETRGKVAKAVFEGLNSSIIVRGRRIQATNAIDAFIEDLASFIRGNKGKLEEFVYRWG